MASKEIMRCLLFCNPYDDLNSPIAIAMFKFKVFL